MMFPINRYNYNNNSNNNTLVGGGEFTNIIPHIVTYIILLLVLVLEISDPLSQPEATENLKKREGLLYLFVAFSVIVPVLVMTLIWTHEDIKGKKGKKAKFFGYFGVTAGFILFQFSLTIAALSIAKPKLSTSQQGYLYSKIIFLFFGMIGLAFTQMHNRICKKSDD